MNSYDASGRKLAARNFTNVVALSQPLNEGEVLKHVVDENERVYISSVHNIDNVEYNSLTTYSFSTASTFESFQSSKLYNNEGYARDIFNPVTNPEYYYFCRDHLGNIREVWRGNRRTVVQRTQYYPSGLPWAKNPGDDTELPANANNRKYNGKEFVEMHGLDEYDSEARWYYPAIMRTTTIDPLAEMYYSISPYAWCGNNPVLMVDPDGRSFKKALQHLKSAGTVSVSFGFQVGFKFDVNNKGVSGKINMLSMEFGGFENGRNTFNVANPSLSKESSLSVGLFGGGVKTEVNDNGNQQTTKTTTRTLTVAFATAENKETTNYVENRNGTYSQTGGSKSETTLETTATSGNVMSGGVALGLGIEVKINWDEVAKSASELLNTLMK